MLAGLSLLALYTKNSGFWLLGVLLLGATIAAGVALASPWQAAIAAMLRTAASQSEGYEHAPVD